MCRQALELYKGGAVEAIKTGSEAPWMNVDNQQSDKSEAPESREEDSEEEEI